jgi:hypothetical protein
MFDRHKDVRTKPIMMDKKIDVFAFAITMYEVACIKHVVLKKNVDMNRYSQQVKNGTRPGLDDANLKLYEAHYPIIELIQKCWHGNPEKRPDFSEIYHLVK